MAEPKKRLTRTRSGSRQAHDFIKVQSLVVCTNCKSKIMPHRVCNNCGFYKGEKIIKDKKEKKSETKKKEELKNE